MVDLNRIVSSGVKSGKILFGTKQTLKIAKSGKVAVLVAASNCPSKIIHELENYSSLSKIPLFVFPSSSTDLGTVCGKPFSISTLAIKEISDPEIQRMVRDSSQGK